MPSITATTEFVVPRSMPIIFAILSSLISHPEVILYYGPVSYPFFTFIFTSPLFASTALAVVCSRVAVVLLTGPFGHQYHCWPKQPLFEACNPSVIPSALCWARGQRSLPEKTAS